MKDEAEERPVLYFDGVCNLCNRSVQFVIRHDRKKRFLFAALQSPAGQQIQEKIKEERGKVPDSLVLSWKGKIYTESDAALHAARLLGGFTGLLAVFLVLPRFIRDPLYRFIARNRYRWFGRKDACMVPTPELKSRFLPQ